VARGKPRSRWFPLIGRSRNALKAEVKRADIIVLAVPIYNFSIPAALKAWVDMVCRNNVDGATALSMPKPTHRKQAVVLLTSNHTLAGASDEFATGFLQHILAFIGCSEIDIVDVTGLADNKTGILASAHEKIQSICQNVTSQNISAAAE
jgi:FMN-dependent NADH-azoreductase